MPAATRAMPPQPHFADVITSTRLTLLSWESRKYAASALAMIVTSVRGWNRSSRISSTSTCGVRARMFSRSAGSSSLSLLTSARVPLVRAMRCSSGSAPARACLGITLDAHITERSGPTRSAR